jgi:hypothetical protein
MAITCSMMVPEIDGTIRAMTVPVMQSPTEITQRLLTPGQAPFLGVVMLDTRFPRRWVTWATCPPGLCR